MQTVARFFVLLFPDSFLFFDAEVLVAGFGAFSAEAAVALLPTTITAALTTRRRFLDLKAVFSWTFSFLPELSLPPEAALAEEGATRLDVPRDDDGGILLATDADALRLAGRRRSSSAVTAVLDDGTAATAAAGVLLLMIGSIGTAAAARLDVPRDDGGF